MVWDYPILVWFSVSVFFHSYITDLNMYTVMFVMVAIFYSYNIIMFPKLKNSKHKLFSKCYAVYPSCGGQIDDVEMWKKYIQSPGFYANNGYQDHQECTWVIKVGTFIVKSHFTLVSLEMKSILLMLPRCLP